LVHATVHADPLENVKVDAGQGKRREGAPAQMKESDVITRGQERPIREARSID
jgi:hypothetical protein